MRQLQADRSALDAKLKEALAAQPAAVDPRELAKAEERIKSLQKENDLLNASLGEQKARPAGTADTNVLGNAQRALQEVNQLLTEEKQRAALLAQEKEALQNQVKTLNAQPESAAALRAENELLKKQLAELSSASGTQDSAKQMDSAKAQLATLQSDKEVLRLEREALQKRIQTLTTENAAAAAVRAENETLQKQVAQVEQLRTQLASLQTEKENWRTEKALLEQRLRQGGSSNLTGTVETREERSQVKRLERERDQLQKKLAAATKELNSRKSTKAAAMQKEVAGLRARVQVLEAERVPFTPEELAAIKSPQTTLASSGTTSLSSEVPPPAAALIAQARRDFSSRQFESAEAKDKEAIQQGANSAPALADLASIQMERDKLDDAEKTVNQALTTGPENAYTLAVLGQIKFRQKRYDEALDALSRAAALEPQNAQVQSWLGVAFSEKGMRIQAETALRKALQIQPDFSEAHNNLAVIYASQQPPLLELARWHYQKALAGGHPKNDALEKLLAPKKTGP